MRLVLADFINRDFNPGVHRWMKAGMPLPDWMRRR